MEIKLDLGFISVWDEKAFESSFTRGLFHIKQMVIKIRTIAEKEGRAHTFQPFALMFSIWTGFTE